MPKVQPAPKSNFTRAIRKVFVSAFVVFSFAVYALHERFGTPTSETSAAGPEQTLAHTQAEPATPRAAPTSTGLVSGNPQPQPLPTLTPLPAAAAIVQGQYKDGEYTGYSVDAYYGIVQVKAVIQNGQIADVKFLQYPNDRRTSIRINTIVMPYLTTEAIQAQSARVNIISGATLTSEAFQMSLQSALNNAKG